MSTELIQQLLTEALQPVRFELVDQSAGHAGHAGNNGGGHYYVTIVSAQFEGKSPVQRHQMVYRALGDLMKQQIHALGINALTPSEETIGN